MEGDRQLSCESDMFLISLQRDVSLACQKLQSIFVSFFFSKLCDARLLESRETKRSKWHRVSLQAALCSPHQEEQWMKNEHTRLLWPHPLAGPTTKCLAGVTFVCELTVIDTKLFCTNAFKKLLPVQLHLQPSVLVFQCRKAISS